MQRKYFDNIDLTFDRSKYSKKYSFIPLATAYKPLRQIVQTRNMIKSYKLKMIEKLPANLKII